MSTIPVSGPWITQKEIDYVTDAVAHAWYGRANEYHSRFEAAFAAYVGRKYAMALPSCTSAIHLALMALGVGPGDEVIVPEITWIATAAPISYVGATPVFADVDPKSWCLSAPSVDKLISARTKAVIPVGIYGGMPDFDALSAICRKHGVPIVEDSAEAMGSTYRGKLAGSFGEVSVFSFHGSKTMTTGEGGMLVTDRADLFQRAQFLRDHGRNPGDTTFFSVEVAHKYKMSAMQAALGLAQVERIEELIARKREIFSWYRDALRGIDGVTLNDEPPGIRNSYWMVSVILDPALHLEKTEFIAAMAAQKISCRPFFHPLSSLPAYQNVPGVAQAKRQNLVSYAISPFGINLPSGFNLTPELVKTVAQAVEKCLATKGSRRNAA